MKLFIEFLEENNIKETFYKNFNLDYANEYDDYEDIDDFLSGEYPHDYLYYAFEWEKTQEGFFFWEKIFCAWTYIN